MEPILKSEMSLASLEQTSEFRRLTAPQKLYVQTLLAGIRDLGIEDLVASINEAWLKAAERSLEENQRSFALLEMSDVLLANGLLAKLKARGYTVLGPADATYAAR